MDIAIAGIKYSDETASIIMNNKDDSDISVYNIGKGEFPDANKQIYIITDRNCEGLFIKPDICMDAIKNIIKNIKQEDIAIINIDDDDLIRHLEGLQCEIITFGYNLKSSITVSKIEEDIILDSVNYMLSLQRSINSVNNKKIEPCEIKINVSGTYNIQSIMAYAAFLLVSDKYV